MPITGFCIYRESCNFLGGGVYSNFLKDSRLKNVNTQILKTFLFFYIILHRSLSKFYKYHSKKALFQLQI